MSSCVLHEKKIIYIHTPKCAGCSVTRYLKSSGDEWLTLANDDNAIAFDSTASIDNINLYTIFTIIRNPVTWSLSGYKFIRREFPTYKNSFYEHLQLCLENKKWKTNALDWNIYWHCVLLPNMHWPKNIIVYKLENLKPMHKWLCSHLGKKYYRNTLPIDNNIELDEEIHIDKKTFKLLKKRFLTYSAEYKYDIEKTILELQFTNRYITASF